MSQTTLTNNALHSIVEKTICPTCKGPAIFTGEMIGKDRYIHCYSCEEDAKKRLDEISLPKDFFKKENSS